MGKIQERNEGCLSDERGGGLYIESARQIPRFGCSETIMWSQQIGTHGNRLPRSLLTANDQISTAKDQNSSGPVDMAEAFTHQHDQMSGASRGDRARLS